MRIYYPELASVKKMQKKSLALVDMSVEILQSYYNRGYALGIRSLYYKLVARGAIDFDNSNYDKLINHLTNARYLGLMDVELLNDPSRAKTIYETYMSPDEAMKKLIATYATDPWLTQVFDAEIWYEKAGMSSIIDRIAQKYTLPHFAIRGEVSTTALIEEKIKGRTKPLVIYYLGDQDPAGVNIYERIRNSLDVMTDGLITVIKLGITIEQGNSHDFPRTKLKSTLEKKTKDDYMEQFGVEYGFEIDALDPVDIEELVDNALAEIIDADAWSQYEEKMSVNIEELKDRAA